MIEEVGKKSDIFYIRAQRSVVNFKATSLSNIQKKTDIVNAKFQHQEVCFPFYCVSHQMDKNEKKEFTQAVYREKLSIIIDLSLNNV